MPYVVSVNCNDQEDKVEHIPDSFQSVQHYHGSYIYPLMEETQAKLALIMDVISMAPFAERSGKTWTFASVTEVPVDERSPSDSKVEEICALCSTVQFDGIYDQRLGVRLSSMLNDSQTSAVLDSISTMQCKHKSSIKIIWGPPGNLLSRDDIVCGELEELFSCSEIFENESPFFVDTIGFEAGMSSTSTLLCKKRSECLFSLRFLQSSLDGLNLPNVISKSSIREFCFQNASLIFCTASSSYNLHSVAMEPLDVLVIDDASQLKECEAIIALQLPDIRHAILIGDECQLPAMVNCKVSEEAGFGKSLFERLSLLGYSKHLLTMQYRMHLSISSFPNSKFYLNQILDAPRVQSESYERHYLPGPMFGPYSFISISDGKEVLDDVGHSLKNMVEVAVVIRILRNLFRGMLIVCLMVVLFYAFLSSLFVMSNELLSVFYIVFVCFMS
ncbi:hypothetical protein HHK36_014649 [Tetracentron sinense]|uniref:Uncharacterized protein n=1 Tax=Tetracentron sinense TaxID=13715 RepID=A0A835DD41_TETSI|nr:hypothetical protein HHK36_014649 [Tetracentron sinense]